MQASSSPVEWQGGVSCEDSETTDEVKHRPIYGSTRVEYHTHNRNGLQSVTGTVFLEDQEELSQWLGVSWILRSKHKSGIIYEYAVGCRYATLVKAVKLLCEEARW